MLEKIKNPCHKIFIYGIIFVNLFLTSCSEDLYEEQINQNKKIIARNISMKDPLFKNNIKLKKSFEGMGLINSNQNNRYEYNDVYDFYIDEENGLYLETDNLESYTFPVYKSETDSTVTNIVFNKNSTGNYDILLAEYNILKNDLPNITEEELANSSVEYTDITEKFGIPELICIEIQEYQYTLEYDPATGYEYVGHWYTTGSYCSWTDAGGGGGSSTGSSTGGGILTGPIDSPHGGGGGQQQSFPDTPCGRLQKRTSSSSFNQKFKSLTTKYNASSETGFGERVNGSGQNEYVNLNAIGSSSLEPFSGMMNFTHVHNNHPKQNSYGDEYDGAVKIQSPGDLFNLIKKCQPANTNPKEAYCIMLSDEGIFALTILDPIPQTFLQSPEWTIFKNDFKDLAEGITGNISINEIERKEKLQIMLLSLLKDAGLENKIGLFEANIENDIVEINISWTRKTLASNGTPNNIEISEQPCN